MEWNEVDLVQEFTVEGQCSKIKVRSCRITWDSLQVTTAQQGADCRRMFMSAGEPVHTSLRWNVRRLCRLATYHIDLYL
ncbi:unnamed protein product [Tetraodon nigroviridis]|uniref:(spotted green pufferfish) hypothetical protein n=1 Tax=Tetraodon nigroviridis TaxID=99883 RepID=Q4TA20_TETNG|nr:unnamed protein product [Tetraodon nigroviridis]